MNGIVFGHAMLVMAILRVAGPVRPVSVMVRAGSGMFICLNRFGVLRRHPTIQKRIGSYRRLILGTVGESSVRTIDGRTMADRAVEWLNDFAVNL